MTDLTALTAPIRARVEAATEGPWETRNEGPGEPWRVCHDREHVIYLGFDTVAEFTENDAEFIASARSDVPRLLQALDAADAALAEKAAALTETAERLNREILDRDINRDPEAANRYSNYAAAADTALRIFRAAVVAALGEGA